MKVIRVSGVVVSSLVINVALCSITSMIPPTSGPIQGKLDVY